ncbi:hypothetical protein [Flavobacterium sp. ASW18X]|uniref:hypothetical protein n=1 Tax=Flavobacterium sp. ASW18X TaxID=2572595 RepID=UPI0010AEE9C7|nr:hypothetical protein [Flavobacterium sp. ASW18X]TKD62294.1 hypothetical protein FBT53_10205 [Flavobacterium sp. ASW18X]
MIGFDFIISKIFKGKEHEEYFSLIDNLPPIFKVFAINFDWTEKATSTSLYFLPYLRGGEIELNGWNYKDVFSKPIIENDPWMAENGFICIATSNKGIFVGTKGEYKDKIFSTENTLDNSIIEIADNIFEFVRGLTDSISLVAESPEEYREFMLELGFEGEELDDEVAEWVNWKKNHNK